MQEDPAKIFIWWMAGSPWKQFRMTLNENSGVLNNALKLIAPSFSTNFDLAISPEQPKALIGSIGKSEIG